MNRHVFSGVLAAAQEAEEWAWAELYEWLAPSLGSYFRVRGFRDPKDLVGEVFVQLARNLGSFRGDVDEFRSWVFMIAHNRLVNERRRLGRRPLTLVADVEPVDGRRSASAEDGALVQIGDDWVLEVLSDLTADQRDVVALRVVVGVSLAETARITGKSIGSIKQLQRRGLEALRRHVRERA